MYISGSERKRNDAIVKERVKHGFGEKLRRYRFYAVALTIDVACRNGADKSPPFVVGDDHFRLFKYAACIIYVAVAFVPRRRRAAHTGLLLRVYIVPETAPRLRPTPALPPRLLFHRKRLITLVSCPRRRRRDGHIINEPHALPS